MRNHYLRTWGLLILIAGLLNLLTGCNNGEKLQQEIQQALLKQKEVKNYRFSGNAEISLESSLPKENTSSLANGLFNFIKNSKLTWEGVSSAEPARLETDIALTPNGTGVSLKLPLLLKDNKLYFNIPLLSAADQYYVLDMSQLSEASKKANPLSPDKLAKANQAAVKIMGILLSGIDKKWFEENKKESKSNGGDKTISININDKNQKTIISSLFAKLPEVLMELQSAGLITVEQADHYTQILEQEQIKQTGRDSLTDKPWIISVSINADGFISGMTLDINYNLSSQDGTVQNNRIALQNRFEEVNKNPKFLKPIPELDKLVNFETVLNKLIPSVK